MGDENLTAAPGTSASTLTCNVCLRNFKSKSQMTNHTLRFCKGPPGAPGPIDPSHLPCPFCTRAFPTLIGLQQHKRHTHPVEYNNEMETAAQGTAGYIKWSLAEVEDMARIELAFRGKHVNQHISRAMDRTLYSIRRKRRTEHYLGVLTRLREEQTAALRKDSFARPRRGKPVSSPFLDRDLTPGAPTTSNTFKTRLQTNVDSI